jgi:ABC-type lipoprotein release transport system permease subunit
MNFLTLLKLGWRNIWRSKLRSLVVIFSIIIGVWGGLLILGIMYGLNNQRMDIAINGYIGNVQIHNENFLDDYAIKHVINNIDKYENFLSKDSRVKAYSKRIVLSGMLSNSNGSSGIQVLGVNPSSEKNVTKIYSKLIEGEYFKSKKNNTILVGKKIADKLNLKLKSKVVVTFQDEKNNLVSLLFRVEGIFRSGNSMFDESNVYVKNQSIRDNLVNFIGFHEMPIVIYENIETDSSLDLTDALKKDLKKIDNTNIIQSWDDIAVELAYANRMISAFLYFFMLIVISGLSFGIINTMLMAVLERKRELGMLMCIGMTRLKIFLMISIETLFLALIALPFGLIFSYFMINYFSVNGIDLSIVAAGLENFGIGTMLYLKLPLNYYYEIGLMIIVITIISSVFPSIRALKINPIEASKNI